MTSPEHPRDEGSIADTQMFRRFVEEEEPVRNGMPGWAWPVIICALVACAALIVVLVTR
ncbi:hypothetical protein GIS00_15130 [Nakamurella sp. YIM 132087]|uniref:Uncharacterized protein n=1 Tax=Nakamurella alba TaxID=2665158 RepID=A0A7K1FR51_9ACTN|nr:hypothetical protein [Nakamurella alba]MTD15274.1 hypothetical protein [Nakamurella alba]